MSQIVIQVIRSFDAVYDPRLKCKFRNLFI